MSLSVNGLYPHSVVFTTDVDTTISSVFAAALFPMGGIPSYLSATLVTMTSGSFTVSLGTKVVPSPFDVSIGLDWSASMRELLNYVGWHVGQSFDPVQAFLPHLPRAIPPSLKRLMLLKILLKITPLLSLPSVGCSAPPLPLLPPHDGWDAVRALLSSDLIAADRPSVARLLDAHGMGGIFLGSAAEYQCALLAHVLLGCSAVGRGFQSVQEMAYFAINTILCSVDLTYPYLLQCAMSLGFDSGVLEALSPDVGCDLMRAYLARRRRALVKDYSDAHPCDAILDDVKYLQLPALVSLASSHRLPVREISRDALLDLLAAHVAFGGGAQTFYAIVVVDLSDAASIKASLHGVEWQASQGVSGLRCTLKRYLARLSKGKVNLDPENAHQSRRDRIVDARAQESVKLKAEWPRLVSPELKQRFKDVFSQFISKDGLETFVCGSCVERCPIAVKTSLSFDAIDFDLLRRPDMLAEHLPDDAISLPSMDAGPGPDPPSTDVDRSLLTIPFDARRSAVGSDDCPRDDGADGLVPDAECDDADRSDLESETGGNSWLDPGVRPPAMPISSGPYSSLLVDPECITADELSGNAELTLCRQCKSELVRGVVPCRSMANKNYLGAVPQELQDLSVPRPSISHAIEELPL
ncbi:hypothetical protein K438DRAFT_1775391 [Mycena galopus ATCC 62051]|nr:hypothetical protein K438DRAFT_1775391 [Mycena galopus ATCC 62051]